MCTSVDIHHLQHCACALSALKWDQTLAVWLLKEQVAIAALDTRALDLAADLIKDIKGRFPESERSTRLAVCPANTRA